MRRDDFSCPLCRRSRCARYRDPCLPVGQLRRDRLDSRIRAFAAVACPMLQAMAPAVRLRCELEKEGVA
jgi:hypothetical protein